ncbi:MAG: TIR domain-containing protein [Hafnia alvei]|uniref:SEFIR domain-containing protein n=1 Tax=Hafnia alvei TaxID=569 RepID=UPI00290732FA|nr:TIR domain-containing protein [Hafnia alvei]MDU7482369.1 TIR domain-containing protein [Hafnia alvei]
MEPKVFVSYSWSSPAHKDFVQQIADRLLSDGVDVIIDIYDLKEGHDKNAFMERMIADESVTHVLVMCDKLYSEKADARKSGVGTESQIISQEVYSSVEQSKFIPIVCQYDECGEPYLPIFLKSRIWVDLSSPEKENENWEKLIRLLNGKPLNKKPKLGKKPSYLESDSSTPTSEALTKFKALKYAVLNEKRGVKHYRSDFIESCWSYLDAMRVREQPKVIDAEVLGNRIISDYKAMRPIRNYIIDWVLLESEFSSFNDFSETLIEFLERMLELQARPEDMQGGWNDHWFGAQRVFVYELFLYIVSALIKINDFQTLHDVYSTHYIKPLHMRSNGEPFARFTSFYGTSELLQRILSTDNKEFYSPTAELIRLNSDREDIPFHDIIQADLLTLMYSLVTDDLRWYPQTYHYAGHFESFPLFIRAAQHKSFLKIATAMGVTDADELKISVRKGIERVRLSQWNNFSFCQSFWDAFNMDALDTIK